MEIDLQEAIYLHKAGKLDDAEVLYRKIIEEHNEAAQAHYLLGIILMSRNAYEDAAPLLAKACELNQENQAFHCAYGENQALLRNYDEAENALAQVLTQDFEHLEALTNLADVLMRKQDYQRAKDTAQLILSKHPHSQPALAIAEGAQPRQFLNVGGASKNITLPRYYDGWEHHLLDIDPNQNPDILCDARELETHEGKLYDAIYCSHNLEHYYRHDVFKVLKGFLHVLKDDGFAEIKVPDINLLMRHAVERNLDIDDVVYNSGMGPITTRDILYGHNKQVEISGVDFYAHKTGFSAQTLAQVLLKAGFEYVHYERREANLEARALAFKKEPTRIQEYLLNVNLATRDRGLPEEELKRLASVHNENKDPASGMRLLTEYANRFPLEKEALLDLCQCLARHERLKQRNLEALNILHKRVKKAYPDPSQIPDISYLLNLFEKEDIGYKKLDGYHNKHKGERLVIIGNGPSLNKMDLSFLKNEITIGMNRIYLGFERFDFLPTYFLCQDPTVTQQFKQEILERVPRNIPKFVNSQLHQEWPDDDDIIPWMTRTSFDGYFTRDARLGCYRAGTSDCIALQLAYHMGFDEIVIIGCDHHITGPGVNQNATELRVSDGNENNHFDPNYAVKGCVYTGNGYLHVKPCLETGKKYFEAAGRKVYDATVEGHMDVFEKIDYREIFGLK